ncbi:RING-type domain-containing protein [Lachancea thermotolerans]
MSQENSASATSGSPGNKKFSHKEKPKKPASHRQHRVNSKPPKTGKHRDGPGKQRFEDDLEFNIQDELVSGNFKARGRKTQISINHLLDFQLPERPSDGEAAAGATRRRTKKQFQEHIHLHGDSFINANFKFLVDDRYTYQEQSLDPNVPIPHEKIVRVTATKGQSCPICLTEEIVAPRMVSCGHLFCHACLLSFFAAGMEQPNNNGTGINYKKKRYKECPLCSTIIRKEKAIPATLTEPDSTLKLPQVGQTDTFQLMCKPHGSMLPLPVLLNVDPMSLHHFPSVEFRELAPYSRIMKCNPQYAIDLYKKDISHIQGQYELDRALYNEDGKFSQLAIEENKLKISVSEQSFRSEAEVLSSNLSQLSLDVGLEKYNDTNAFFFFQTAFDANTRYYLSPLDVKVLLTAFGHYSGFPPSLTAQVEDVHYGTVVTESLMQRYKYFGHLPIGSEMAFVDLDWRTADVIPSEVYQSFAVELSSRRRKSTWRKQREDKEKKRYERKLEREQQEFYMRENGSTDHATSVIKPVRSVPLQKLPEKKSDTGSAASAQKSASRLEKTVWGTSIPASDKAPEGNQEDEELEKLLGNLNQNPSPRQGRKKKRMVTLLSSNPSRGSL